MSQPLVTAIVSTYGAERFMRGCLTDLVEQTIFKDVEVLVIDSGSPQGESEICREFMRKHPQIRLLRTNREPLYVTWNRAIQLARGKYFTNANTDDRHHPDFMELMASTLDRQPEVGLAYADQFISYTENETFAECESRNAKLRRWPDYTPQDLMLRCITGSQPMWRKSLHDALGGFDTRYRIAADYDMWLRIAENHLLQRVPTPLGVFFDSPETISGLNNRLQMDMESLDIKQNHMRKPFWRGLAGLRKRLAAEVYGTGYQHILRGTDLRDAGPFIRAAIKFDPMNFRYLKTYAIRCIAGIEVK
jgi:glycosyltransferase involved in cell wall biosynthesis